MSNINKQKTKQVVLVIEDNNDIAELSRYVLEENGCEVILVAGIAGFRGNTAIGLSFKNDAVEIDLSTVQAATVDFSLANGSMHGPQISLELVARGIKTCAASGDVGKAKDIEQGPYSRFGFSTYVEYKCVTDKNIDRVFAALGLVRTRS